jgi:hypothetical protein
MADTNTSKPIFSAFEWGHDAVNADGVTVPGRVYADLLNKTHDITLGVATILEILERDRLSAEFGDDRPILSVHAESALMRLAIRSAHMLRDEAEHSTQWAYDQCTPEGRKAKTAAWAELLKRQA